MPDTQRNSGEKNKYKPLHIQKANQQKEIITDGGGRMIPRHNDICQPTAVISS